MDISILGLKLNVEMLILIGVIYLIIVGHTVGGCCNFHGLIEGMRSEMPKKNNGNGDGDNMAQVGPSSTSNATITKEVAGALANKVEGFVGANTNYGESSSYSLTNNTQYNTGSWSMPNLTVTPGKPFSQGVQNILNRQPQPVPLPEGEMLLFANTPFKPECCPNSFSTSTGCACMTTDQYNYLVMRGGNNAPYSEY